MCSNRLRAAILFGILVLVCFWCFFFFFFVFCFSLFFFVLLLSFFFDREKKSGVIEDQLYDFSIQIKTNFPEFRKGDGRFLGTFCVRKERYSFFEKN